MPNRPQNWKPHSLLSRITDDKKVRSWLTSQGSLTLRLRQHCPDINVQVLSESLQVPLVSEATALNMANNERAWVRCVLLKCHQQSWVYARTVIPNFNPSNPWQPLQKLGNKPLGEVLYQMPSIERTPFEFCKQPLNAWPLLNSTLGVYQDNPSSFARRSVFLQQASPLLLTEVFLPGLFNFY